MRNLKTKGFTLVELIVVIAIIGVLAAVLVPAMLGYMRDSKISQANQNAHAVYTAAQAAITKYATAKGTSQTKNSDFGGSVAAKGGAPGSDAKSTAVTLDDFGDYLGDQFVGWYSFHTGASGDTVDYALWTLDKGAAPTLADAKDEAAQIAGYKAGTLVGVHPQYPTAAGASSGT